MEEFTDDREDADDGAVAVFLSIVLSKLDVKSVLINESLLDAMFIAVAVELFESYLNTLPDDVVDATDCGV